MTASIHYLHDRRRALHTVERQAHLCGMHTNLARQQAAHRALQRALQRDLRRPLPWKLAAFWLTWLLMLSAGLYLAAHDPYTLAHAASHLLGEVPA